MNSTTTFGRSSRKIQGLSLAGLAVVAFGILAGIGIWQATSGDGGSTVTTSQPQAANPPVFQPKPMATHFYLVESQAQAEEVLAWAYQSEAELAQYGALPHNIETIDVSTAEGREMVQALQDDLSVAASSDPYFDASLVRFFDLTSGNVAVAAAPAVAPSNAASVPFVPDNGGRITTYVYLVESKEQADDILFSDAASRMELAELGLTPDFSTMVLDISTPEDLAVLNVINGDMANWDPALGAPSIEIIDLTK